MSTETTICESNSDPQCAPPPPPICNSNSDPQCAPQPTVPACNSNSDPQCATTIATTIAAAPVDTFTETASEPVGIVGVAQTLPVTGPAPYGPTIGIVGALVLLLGAASVRIARR